MIRSHLDTVMLLTVTHRLCGTLRKSGGARMRGLELLDYEQEAPRLSRAAGTLKADSERTRSGHSELKKEKNKRERRRAKQDPSCAPGYGRYSGWET